MRLLGILKRVTTFTNPYSPPFTKNIPSPTPTHHHPLIESAHPFPSFRNIPPFATNQPFTRYLRLTLVFMWNSALREKFKFLFFKSFLQVLTKFSFWPEDWALGYHSMKFRHFPDISWVLSRSATRSATRIYRVYK